MADYTATTFEVSKGDKTMKNPNASSWGPGGGAEVGETVLIGVLES